MTDLLDPKALKEVIFGITEEKKRLIASVNGSSLLDPNQIYSEYVSYGEQLREFIVDTAFLLNEKLQNGSRVLFEGAQGTLLDIDHGTYPYVTSSNTTVGGVATGAGFGPLKLDYVLGIVKAYTTRVGSGPFPTELECEVGQHLGVKGHEFGATTGRKRRTGWFDAVAMKRAVQINSITGFCLTKLDVLDGLESLQICVGYKDADGNVKDVPPMAADGYEKVTPVYEEMPGWTDNTFGVTEFEALPQAAKNYIKRLEELTGVPVDIVSTGPDRNETIVLRSPYDA